MKPAVLLLLAGCCWGQAAPIPAAPSESNWYGAGGAWTSNAQPGTSSASGWAAYGRELSSSVGVWSFSQLNVYLTRDPSTHKPLIANGLSTGAAVVVRQISLVTVLAFGTVGVSTAGSTSGGVFPFGGLVDVRLGSTRWHLDIGYQVITANNLSTQKPVLFGVGRLF